MDRRAQPIAGIDDAVHVSVGLFHACAALASGGVRCWGGNPRGQLGDGTTETSRVPVVVKNLKHATMVAVAFQHSCALHQDGAVSCWGGNMHGQLGDGGTDDRALAKRLSGLTDVVSLSANGNGVDDATALALDTTWGEKGCVVHGKGKVSCWSADEKEPIVLVPRKDIAGAVDVAVGDAADLVGCAVLASGRVKCWKSWQSATEAFGERKEAPAMALEGIEDAQRVEMTGKHACVLHASGKVSCWGRNLSDEVGAADSAWAYAPVRVAM